MDGIVLPGEQETLEAEQGAQGEEGFRGGGAGDECAVSGYPLGILMEPPRDPGEKEEETKLDKAVQARRRERMHAGRFVNSRNIRLEGGIRGLAGQHPQRFFLFYYPLNY